MAGADFSVLFGGFWCEFLLNTISAMRLCNVFSSFVVFVNIWVLLLEFGLFKARRITTHHKRIDFVCFFVN